MKIKKLYLFQIKKIKKIVLNKFILYKKKKCLFAHHIRVDNVIHFLNKYAY